MLYGIFKELKPLLSAIEGVKKVQFFNDNYSGIIHTEPVLFVEFPKPLHFEDGTGGSQQAEVSIRIHTVHKMLSGTDNEVNELVIESHEVVNTLVYETLCKQWHRTEYQLHAYMKGWLVTTQDFTAILTTEGLALTESPVKPVVSVGV